MRSLVFYIRLIFIDRSRSLLLQSVWDILDNGELQTLAGAHQERKVVEKHYIRLHLQVGVHIQHLLWYLSIIADYSLRPPSVLLSFHGGNVRAKNLVGVFYVAEGYWAVHDHF